MKNIKALVSLFAAASLSFSSAAAGAAGESFKDDVSFLRKYDKGLVVLSDESGKAQVAVSPLYQGRVMTSTSDAQEGIGYGWVNRDLISSGQQVQHIHPYGGEDRLWIGPEGGQFSVFFAPGVPFDLAHWFTPAPLDTESLPVVEQGKDYVRFQRKIELVNYSKTHFDLEVTREIRMLGKGETAGILGMTFPDSVRTVAFESVNTLKNTGSKAWNKKTGLLSIWVLGMMNAGPSNTVVVPFKAGPESELGLVVHDTYFGKVPADRLVVRDGDVFFKADAAWRSKFGVPPARCKPFVGSYDPQKGVLTLVQFDLPPGRKDYVNSLWELQKDPYGGDVANSYNDGPASPGAQQLGKFYEMESSSPALALKPGESATHHHRTFHFQGPEPELDQIARSLLGVGLDEITAVFKP